MNGKQSLDKVIKKVDSNYQPKSDKEQIIRVDLEKKEVVESVGLFGGLFGRGKLAYYRVVMNASAVCRNLDYTVSDFASRDELEIFIDYQVSCLENQANKVAIALSGEGNPVDELNSQLKDWIEEFIGNQSKQFIDSYSSERQELVEKLQKKARDEIGLKLEAKISVANEEELNKKYLKQIIEQGLLKPFAPNPIQFSVKVGDYDNDLNLQLKISLEVDDELEAAKNYGYEAALVNFVKEEVRKYFLQNVKLNDFVNELQNSVREGLIKRLDGVLIAKGRKVGYLSLGTDSLAVLKERLAWQDFYAIEDFEVLCRIKGYDKPIKVNNTLQLIIEDIGKYNTAVVSRQIPLNTGRKPDLDTWAKNKLETIIKPLLLEKNYVEILLDFEPREAGQNQVNAKTYAQEVQTSMKTAASLIGYNVKHIVSLPDLEPFKFKDYQEIETVEREYGTRDANVRVKLSIVAIVKIDNLREIEKLLNPDNSLEEQIKETIYKAASLYLTALEPERFYMRFYAPDKEFGEQKSVEQELIDEITQVLNNKFKATVSSVIPKMGNTDIVELFQELQGQIGAFEIEVKSLSGGEPVKYQGSFKVLKVEKSSWYQFQSMFQSRLKSRPSLLEDIDRLRDRKAKLIPDEDSQDEVRGIDEQIKVISSDACGINLIKEQLHQYLKSKLDTFDNQNLLFIDYEQRKVREGVFNQWVNDPDDPGSLVNQFGLVISLFSVSRQRTELQTLEYETTQQVKASQIKSVTLHLESREKHIAQLQQELDTLYKKRLKLIAQEDTEEELEELDRKINTIQKETLTPSLEAAESKLKQVESERPKVTGFDDLAKKMNLPVSKTNPTLKSSDDSLDTMNTPITETNPTLKTIKPIDDL